jgi:anaerobic magnesium-protoporphyrin IX monomethyl ester cyclase
MKVTFLEPCNYSFYHSQTSGPLGLAYIASYLEQHLAEKLDISIEVDVEHLMRNKPDIVGISAYTETFPRAVAYAERIKKELNIPVLIGGKHITALPENLKPCFDAGVVGDGERTMTELMQLYIEKKGFFPEDLVNVEGIVFRDGNELHITPQREALRELDILPPPKRDILHAYWPNLSKEWYWPQGLYTSRGCPYKCPFCIHSKIRFVTRYHSPERIVGEISEIISKFPGQKNITIHDDLFTISKKRLRELADLIVAEKIDRKVSFSCMCKSNLFDEEIASILKEMNVRFIAFGFESGDEKTLQYLKKDSSKIKENIEAIDSCNKYGIDSAGYFILGAPPETKEGLLKTYWFMRSNYPPMSVVSAFCLTPFPGTKTWDDAYEKGLVNPETEIWEKYNYTDYEINKKTFLNENYDFLFFREVYEKYFKTLIRKNSVFGSTYLNERVKPYYDEVFHYLKNYDLKYGDAVLEVGTYHVTSIKNFFEERKEISHFDQWIYHSDNEKIQAYEAEATGSQQFDLVVFNHSLEQMISPNEKLAYIANNYLKSGGKIIILLKNPQYIGNLANLLFKQWDSNHHGVKKLDDFHQVNISSLKETMQGLMLENIGLIPIEEDISQFAEIYSNILPVIGKQMNIDDFMLNSSISNFILVAVKPGTLT